MSSALLHREAPIEVEGEVCCGRFDVGGGGCGVIETQSGGTVVQRGGRLSAFALFF